MGTESKNSPCREFEALFEDALGAESGGEEARRAEEHAKVCETCRTAWHDARGGTTLLRVAAQAAEPAPFPGWGYERVIMARIRAHQINDEKTGLWQPLVFLASRLAISATLALGLLLAYDVTAHPAATANVAGMRAAQPGDLLG
ncbi:MAG: hypothetical protein ACRD4M_02810, partial [Candidatus Acidiferrales bacterium]